MLRVAIVDDERHVLERFEKITAHFPELNVCGLFESGEKLLAYLQTDSLDAIFLDIEMPGWNGLDLAEAVKKCTSGIQIIFLTAYQKYAVEAFEIEAQDYILKPLTRERLEKTVRRLVKLNKQPTFQLKPYIQVFGNFEVYHKGMPQVFKNARVKELLAYLVHKRGQTAGWQLIAAALWPEFTPQKAQSNFHTTTFMLRSRLFEAGLAHLYQNLRGAYRIIPDTFDCDLDRFEKLVASANATQVNRDNLIQKLTSVYRGGYFEDNGYEWANPRAMELEALYRQILTSLNFSAMDLV